jgi:hypothetical protein
MLASREELMTVLARAGEREQWVHAVAYQL